MKAKAREAVDIDMMLLLSSIHPRCLSLTYRGYRKRRREPALALPRNLPTGVPTNDQLTIDFTTLHPSASDLLALVDDSNVSGELEFGILMQSKI